MTASPHFYFLLVFVLSVPFYLLGAAGGRLPGLPMLPASALMAFVPMVAALFLVLRRRSIDGIVAELGRAPNFGWQASVGWYLTALLFMPLVCGLEFGVLRLTGSDLPMPQVVPGEALFFFVAFFVGAIGEEAGWQGYAYPALRSHLNALAAAVVLGAVWALWHVIPFVQLGRSADWIFWHSLSAVALRIVIVWQIENTGKSIFIAVLFHTMINVSWALFPIAGSYYDPFVTFSILVPASGLIVVLWGAPTLAGRGAQRGAETAVRPKEGASCVQNKPGK